MTNEQIKKSLVNQLKAKTTIEANPITFEVQETTTVIKEYSANDLPLYFKWDAGFKPWYFRVRNRGGKIVTDLLKQSSSDGYELTYSTVTSAFAKDNEPINEDAWRNEMHNFINQIK